MINQIIKDYSIIKQLGQGGMATVYLAFDNKFDSNVAIKLLNKEYTHNENIRKRFLAEAKSMFRMSHPNIIKVTDLIDDNDTVAFVMEYLDGETLKEFIERKGKLSDEEIKNLFSQMLDAVGYVHKQKLVHRDIKPSNFMINREGLIKLMDFGIAKNTDSNTTEYTQTGTGMQMGTPMYMSPEQITETKSVTAQSDIYSLGVVLWQMVTGSKPYDTSTLSTFQLQMKIVQETLPKTNTNWDEIIEKATNKDIERRFSSCNEFLKSLFGSQQTNNSSLTNNYLPQKSNEDIEKTIVVGDEKTIINSKNEFPTIKIGDQKWMIKNLDIVNFRNGDKILEAKTMIDWNQACRNKKPVWCYYNFDPSNNYKYGKIYNWYAINDYRIIAPIKFKIPTANDFICLIDYLGGMEAAGNKSRVTKKNNFNESRFSGVPSGYIDEFGFQRLDIDCAWWTETFGSHHSEYFIKIFKLSPKGIGYAFLESEYSKKCGFSVRCISGESTKVNLKNSKNDYENTVVSGDEKKQINAKNHINETDSTEHLKKLNDSKDKRISLNNKNKILDLFNDLTNGNKVYLTNNIPIRKLSNFIDSYNEEFINDSEFLVYYDDTLFGKGDDGFLILFKNQKFYFLVSNYSPSFKIAMCLQNDNVNNSIVGYKFLNRGILINFVDKKENKYEMTLTYNSKKILKTIAKSIDLFQ
jgi:uncharacterized protein (TIGR02145 family)